MKIALFHVNLPQPGRRVGGVEMFVDRLGTALSNAGHEVDVISLTAGPPSPVYHHRHLFKRLPFLYRSRVCVLFLLPFLLNFVDFGLYDVLHFHGSDWFFCKRNLPTIRTFYGSALWEARTATNVKRKLSLYLLYPMEHLSAWLATVTLAIGPETAKLYRADRTVKLFSPSGKFHPGKKTIFPSFLFIGAWGGRKRGRFVAQIFSSEILPVVPDAQLYMASDFVPNYPGITDLKHPSDERLSATLRESWALLSASTYEGFGIPYLEALMSGTVVITTPNSGASHVLEDGKFGCIVSDVLFGSKILEIVSNAALRCQLGASGLDRAAAFSEAIAVAEHIHAYDLAKSRFSNETVPESDSVQ